MNNNIKNLIEKSTLALSTINQEGTSHIIAVSCAKVLDGNLIITDNYMRKTKENIINNENVSICVWDNEEGFELIEAAKYHDSGKWKEFVKKLEENKGMPAKGAILVKINKINKLLG
jgi:predicted pyridoxine 5'-phosphate oxidase superfamily flavin-nucleotide-binding protein